MTLPASLRVLALVAFAPVALAATGCRSSSPCSPPTCLAEAPVSEPAPAVRYSPPVRVTATPSPAPAPMVAAAPDPDQQAKLETMRLAIEAKNRKTAEIEAELAAKQNAVEASLKSKADAETAAQRLADELKGVPGAQVLLEGSSVSVIVTDSFESGSDRLRTNPDLRAALKAASMAIARHPEAKVSVVGHTDSQPIQRSAKKWTDNEQLSKARAEAVAAALASDGAPRERLSVEGKGSAEPLLAPERTASDRAKNRRVEIEFAFSS
jgi:flagellar motor protein MotB